MDIQYPRFECRRERTGTWMVWDNFKAAKAELGGGILDDRAKQAAAAACKILTRIYERRLAAQAFRRKRIAAGHF